MLVGRQRRGKWRDAHAGVESWRFEEKRRRWAAGAAPPVTFKKEASVGQEQQPNAGSQEGVGGEETEALGGDGSVCKFGSKEEK